MSSKTFYFACVLVLLAGGIIFFKTKPSASYTPPSAPALAGTAPLKAPGILINVVNYSCDGGKSIMAGYFEGTSQPVLAPGEPPVPTGSVALTFDGGRMMTLKQTISADGARYANSDESFVFWSKGNGAMILQNGQEKDYTNCVVAQSVATTTLPTIPNLK
jgi:hypothetical protein